MTGPTPSRLPVSAVVVSCDEGHLLARCLASLTFCDEVVVVDLESTDDTALMARRHGTTYWRHPRVSCIEYLYPDIVGRLKHDWVLTVDPDEVVDLELARNLIEQFPGFQSAMTGRVTVPRVFYFGRRKLRGTVWGAGETKHLLLNRLRVDFTNVVHRGHQCRPGFTDVCIPADGASVVHHYWATTWGNLYEKHRRYAALEGKARWDAGQRPSWASLLTAPVRRFYECYISRQGYREGVLGITLSAFWMWYEVACQRSLTAYRREADSR